MMNSRSGRSGLTIIEVVIGALIISIIMAVVMNMFGAGLRGSTKGMANLTNMEAAAVLMSQIEYDLLRATEISDPAPDTADKVARWEMLIDESSGKGTVIYNLLADGIERQLDCGTGNQKYIYCKGLDVSLQFRHLLFKDPEKDIERAGMWVELAVASAKKSNNGEEFKMKRLILCKNVVRQIVP
jgi:hypothetical protein